MTARIISAGWGERRPLVALYLVPRVQPPGAPHLDDQIRAALPGACIIAYSDADGEPLATTELRARDAGYRGWPLVLVGYSAGCLRGVRQRLLDGADPSAVVAIDGTYASWPVMATWQLDTWRRVFDDARAGRRLFVATHTYQVYTEQLRSPDTPFASTVTVLRRVTGWPLEQGGPPPLGVERSEGDAHVHSYASATIDGTAHSLQLQQVLPEMLRRYVAPWLARTTGPARSPTPTPATLPTGAPPALRRGDRGPEVSAWQVRLHERGFDPGAIDAIFGPITEAATIAFQRAEGLPATGVVDAATSAAAEVPRAPSPRPTITEPVDLGAALLRHAQVDLEAGVRETWGRNDGPRIRDYLAGTGAPWGSAWCAAATRYWLRAAAAELAAGLPIPGSVGAKATLMQLQRAGRWVDAAELRRHPERLRPGMLVVWHRGAPTAWTGHIGVCSRVDSLRFASIEGNSGSASDRVAEMHHHLGEAHLLGAGWVD